MDQEWIIRKGSASYWSVSDGELESIESQNILLVKRDLALHNGAKASIVSLTFAEVAELVDAHDSGSCGGHLVEVRVLSSALSKSTTE
jgi:hypothetical protein